MHDAPDVNAAGRPWLARLDATLGLLVEVPAALLVVADIGVLFWGVVARFVLHRPLVWSDELASLLFLWLAMMGAVVALRRGEHMRMTALVSKANPRQRALLEAVATGACLAFLGLVACCIGVFVTTFYALLVNAHLIGQLTRLNPVGGEADAG